VVALEGRGYNPIMWPTLFIIALILLAAAVAYCVWLFAERRALRAERDRVTGELAQRESAIEGYMDQIEQAQTTLNEKQNELTKASAQLEGIDDKFKALANDVLKQSNEQFLQLAKKTFDGEQKDAAAQLEQRKQAIESLIKPIRESLDKHSKAVTDIEKDRKQDQGSLKQQVASMLLSQKQLEHETKWLANSLRQSGSVRGKWGEMSLKRIAEMAGMVEHCDFDAQVKIWTGEKNQQPDMVVNLPSNRLIVVDAKAPMSGYLDAINTDNDQDRKQYLKQHSTNVEERVAELARKDYTQCLSYAADFVVLFIPGDSFLAPAVQSKPGMIESALARGVVIATPTTLISLLRVIEMGWREKKMAESAQEISKLGQDLHERIVTLVERLAQHHKSLKGAIDSYNKLVGSFEKNLIPGARKFKDLGAGSSKVLPADPAAQIEITPREVKQITSSE
jgi:DNA recombination protein RmuC